MLSNAGLQFEIKGKYAGTAFFLHKAKKMYIFLLPKS